MSITDPDKAAALTRLYAALTAFDQMEVRILAAFEHLQDAQAERAEAGRQHLSALWGELNLAATRHALYDILVALEK